MAFTGTTGCASLCALESMSKVGFKHDAQLITKMIAETKTDFRGIIKTLVDYLPNILEWAIIVISMLFIVSGLFLLLGDLINEEGFVQLFVWLMLIAIALGYLVIAGLGYDCSASKFCILRVDWVSIAFTLTAYFFYLSMWIYFISVANSFVLNGDTPEEY
ncbi:uncharacterized protein LOC142983683 isoform X2 [Anticarsia gemmatalis]|uniref:uncharacterized protein LOC142983683 isoform X2 n=1 Tax=Anticarsia gemmatalis TaxID=129554 RepID=UPI003F76B775